MELVDLQGEGRQGRVAIQPVRLEERSMKEATFRRVLAAITWLAALIFWADSAYYFGGGDEDTAMGLVIVAFGLVLALVGFLVMVGDTTGDGR